jgi:hypothetical protein
MDGSLPTPIGCGRPDLQEVNLGDADVAPIPDATFNQWLTHHLRRLYDPVASEPLPAELIRLLESRLR